MHTNHKLKPLTAAQREEVDRRVRDGEVNLDAAIAGFLDGYRKKPFDRRRKRKPARERLPLPFAARATDNLTPKQAAQYLGVSEKTLANLRHYGGGPVYQQPRKLVTYKVSDLDAYLESGRRRSTSHSGGIS